VPTKSKRDEEKWQKAKAVARDRGQGDNYALIMGIYKKMDPDYFKTAAARVAASWIVRLSRDEGLWQEFLGEMYDGGHRLVRNTNRDTRDRYPQVEAATLLRTDKKFSKLLRGQFGKWLERRRRQGPPGEPVSDLSELRRGQTLEWTEGRNPARGTVTRARPDRAIVRRDDGSTVHITPRELESWRPRVRQPG